MCRVQLDVPVVLANQDVGAEGSDMALYDETVFKISPVHFSLFFFTVLKKFK